MADIQYTEWVQKEFRPLSMDTINLLNGITGPQQYWHVRELRPLFSVTGKWETTTFSNTAVMADTVAMDSELPVKKRPSFGSVTGDLPKLGMMLQLNENQLTHLDTLIALGQQQAAIDLFFNDTPAVIRGILEKIEYNYHYGLSTGVALITDADNTGTGVRLDYGYPAANKFGVSVLWSNVASKPFDDIQRVLDAAAAKGNNITRVRLDNTTLQNIAKTTQAKELFAFNSGYTGGNIPTPSPDQLNQFTSNRYGFTFEVMNRTCYVEKNGVQTPVNPWKAGSVVFLTQTGNVGDLVYARLAEHSPERQARTGATYVEPTPYMLVSKYNRTEPSITEFTKSQARVFPVINNVNSIYLLDSTLIQA